MNEPIYPDKTKTGLAALKPLTDAFFAEPERWVWEEIMRDGWESMDVWDANENPYSRAKFRVFV